jgi:hypothetical protein
MLLVVLAAFAGGVAGCGDDKVKEANAYVKAVNEAQSEFATKSNTLVRQITPSDSAKQGAALFEDFYGAVDTFVSRLRKIKPPASVRALHAKLTSALVRFGGRLRSAGADVTSDNAGRILDGQAKLARATQEVTRAINATLAQINSKLKS